jgi:hypothetical protein
MTTPPNKPAAPNPAITPHLLVGHHWRGSVSRNVGLHTLWMSS